MSYNLFSKIAPQDTVSDLLTCFDRWPEAEFMHARNLRDDWDTAEVMFEFHDQPVRVAYSLQRHYGSNLRAIYLTLEGMRLAYVRGLGDILGDTVSQMLQLQAGIVARDPYEVLGVRPDSPIEVIEAAYKAQARRAHPDAGGSDDAMRELNAAMERVKQDRGVAA